MPRVDDVEMPVISPARFQRFDDIAPMLLAPVSRNLGRLLLQPIRKIRLEPTPALRADAQIAARLAVDPVRQIDPLPDLFRPLAIPRQIFAEMSVGFRAVISKPTQHVDSHFLGLGIFRMRLEHLQQRRHAHTLAAQRFRLAAIVQKIDSPPLHLDKPGLVIQPGGSGFHILPREL